MLTAQFRVREELSNNTIEAIFADVEDSAKSSEINAKFPDSIVVLITESRIVFKSTVKNDEVSFNLATDSGKYLRCLINTPTLTLSHTEAKDKLGFDKHKTTGCKKIISTKLKNSSLNDSLDLVASGVGSYKISFA